MALRSNKALAILFLGGTLGPTKGQDDVTVQVNLAESCHSF